MDLIESWTYIGEDSGEDHSASFAVRVGLTLYSEQIGGVRGELGTWKRKEIELHMSSYVT